MTTAILEWPLDCHRSERLLEFCLLNGVDCFAVSFLFWQRTQRQKVDADFFNRLAPFSLGERLLERTVVPAGQDWCALTECWSLNEQTIHLILNACEGSLTNYGNGRIPEDWRFYRNDDLILGFVSHEQYAFLRLSREQLNRFKELGIPHAERSDSP
jgi:hypothetical protein